MTLAFKASIENLSNRLDLVSQELDNNLFSITIDERWPVHFSDLNGEYVVLFTSLGKLSNPQIAMRLLADNLFDSNPIRPRVGLDDTSQNLLLWSQVAYSECDETTLYHALTVFIERANVFDSWLGEAILAEETPLQNQEVSQFIRV
ncbi:hypothetical protein FM037_27610 [Shewanella psychropiezotolerans]|uniref:Uncharacterized protein n=1 Tax=Shewanella psychropiezotolerans TaxID=2593655 RepID=A0ABX5X4R4_9GAMM|nr:MULTISPECIES: CesT family type III secretion system chaperone [Shewanella]MPY25686.1 hypothetical protein [Shewanella sp. YLB-07]QDO86345.1 hypothetical protein FM037_27610 [Shewanella psychropiezotolerans]